MRLQRFTSVRRRLTTTTGLVVAGLLLAVGTVSPSAAVIARQARPTFKAAVDRVQVTAVVRKRNGQPVTDLLRDDFELLDNGQPRPILDFRSEPTPATLALLVDYSGSMSVAARLGAARAVAEQVLAWLTAGVDQVGLYAFDTRLQELQSLQPSPGNVLHLLETTRPFGSTSLYDAIAETGRQVAVEGGARRAVVALTDGGENSSHLTASEVTNIASSIDVPVYIIVVVSPFDRLGVTEAEDRAAYEALANGPLGNLARWTGGEIFLASSPAHTSLAARQIVTELRHQYFIGFEPDNSRPGWHPISVRTRQKDLVVRARSGYVARYRPESHS
jgi:Ca-activated chloride channel family protein